MLGCFPGLWRLPAAVVLYQEEEIHWVWRTPASCEASESRSYGAPHRHARLERPFVRAPRLSLYAAARWDQDCRRPRLPGVSARGPWRATRLRRCDRRQLIRAARL